MTGTLFICATPIGNLGDISTRVLDTLKGVDLIAAEDTRHTRALLHHFDIQKPLISYHEHNQKERTPELIRRLLEGQDIALVSDAGTPLISDPGAELIPALREAGIPYTSLPGPCALITALTLSGLPARRFIFEGFLPLVKKERKGVLESLAAERRTMVFYEAPHRLARTLQDLADHLGPARPLALCRELTKLHEEVERSSLGESLASLETKPPRGEYVLVVEGLSEDQAARVGREKWESKSPAEHLKDYMDRGLNKKEAMKAMALDFGIRKSEIYDQINKN